MSGSERCSNGSNELKRLRCDRVGGVRSGARRLTGFSVRSRSIGVLTYALLTGYTPFTGATNQETYCNITSQEVDFPDDLFADISDNAKDFISGLLVKNPR